MTVDNHGDRGVVIFETGELFAHEFSANEMSVGSSRRTSTTSAYLEPMWPLSILRAKSMCILVTSGGRMAAPGPHLSFMICGRSVSTLSDAHIIMVSVEAEGSVTYALHTKQVSVYIIQVLSPGVSC